MVENDDGAQRIAAIGDTWNSAEPCVRFICQESEDGEPNVKMFREYCYLSCHNV